MTYEWTLRGFNMSADTLGGEGPTAVAPGEMISAVHVETETEARLWWNTWLAAPVRATRPRWMELVHNGTVVATALR